MSDVNTSEWLPPYIEIASIDKVMSRVTEVLESGFAPHYLDNMAILLPSDQWDQIEFGVNEYALASAVGNALKDIQRWATFHLSKPGEGKTAKPDRHKYAGFLGKWIAKERPIYLRLKNPADPINIPADMYRVNAYFAVAVMRGYLDNDMDAILEQEIAYILHFREEKGETLALLAYCAEKLFASSAAR